MACVVIEIRVMEGAPNIDNPDKNPINSITNKPIPAPRPVKKFLKLISRKKNYSNFKKSHIPVANSTSLRSKSERECSNGRQALTFSSLEISNVIASTKCAIMVRNLDE